MPLKPVGGHIVIRTYEVNSTTAAGIILPETSKDRPEQGEVVAVGPGTLLDNGQRAPMDVAVGQRIVFKKYAPDELKIDGETLYVITASDVIGIIE